MAMVGEAQLIALEEARLITVRPGLAGAEVSTAHPLYGEILRADMPVMRLPAPSRPGRRPGDGRAAGPARPRPGGELAAGQRPGRRSAAAPGGGPRGPRHQPRDGRTARPPRPRDPAVAAGDAAARRDPHEYGRGDDAAALLAGCRPTRSRRRTARPSPTAPPSARDCSPATRAAAPSWWPPWLPGTRRPAVICTPCTPRCSRSTPAWRTGSRSGCPSCSTGSCRRRPARSRRWRRWGPSTGSGTPGPPWPTPMSWRPSRPPRPPGRRFRTGPHRSSSSPSAR